MIINHQPWVIIKVWLLIDGWLVDPMVDLVLILRSTDGVFWWIITMDHNGGSAAADGACVTVIRSVQLPGSSVKVDRNMDGPKLINHLRLSD